MTAKSIITIDTDEDGRPFVTIVFDPPVPDRPSDPVEEEKWLEQVPSTQLAGFIVMDGIMDMFGDDIEVNSVQIREPSNDTKH